MCASTCTMPGTEERSLPNTQHTQVAIGIDADGDPFFVLLDHQGIPLRNVDFSDSAAAVAGVPPTGVARARSVYATYDGTTNAQGEYVFTLAEPLGEEDVLDTVTAGAFHSRVVDIDGLDVKCYVNNFAGNPAVGRFIRLRVIRFVNAPEGKRLLRRFARLGILGMDGEPAKPRGVLRIRPRRFFARALAKRNGRVSVGDLRELVDRIREARLANPDAGVDE